jgi:hypothetical protein
MLNDETRNRGSILSKDSTVSKSQLNIRNINENSGSPSDISDNNLS